MSDGPPNTTLFVLALGLLVGFVIGFVMLLSRLPVDPGFDDIRVAETGAGGEAGDYEFYTLLADQRAPRPTASRPSVDRPIAVNRPIPVARASVAPATRVVPGNAQRLDRRSLAIEGYREIPASSLGQESYYLQAGNFRAAEEAERARAVVLMLGLDAFIVTRRDSDGRTGYRVRIGPFFDQTRLTAAKKKLRGGNVPYDIIRVTG